MSKKITEIEGIGPVLGEKFENAGIKTTEALLEKGATKKGRKEIAEKTGIDEKKVLTFVNMADLFRVKGIGRQFSELLKASGVDTIKELRTRNAENLHAKLTEVQAKKKITKAVPALKQVEDFINQAKGLEPMITY